MENCLSPAQAQVEKAFRRFLDQRDESSAKDMIPAFMGLTIKEALEHKGCHIAMLEDIFDEAESQGWGNLENAKEHIGTLRLLILHTNDQHVRLEYCLNRWLYNRDEEYAKEIREAAKRNGPLSEFLKSDIETRAVLEAV